MTCCRGARRRLLGLTTFLAIGAIIVALSAQGVEAGTLYVTNQASGELAILDDASLTVRKLIRVGDRVWGVAVAPDGKSACVSYGVGLAVVNLEAGRVEQRVELGGQGMGVAISREGSLCYVAVHRSGGDRLVAVDRLGAQIRGQTGIGERAFGVYLSRDGSSLYVPEHDPFTLSVIETASPMKRRTISLKPLGEGAFDKPHYLALSPDGKTLYLPFQGKALVTIDTSTFGVTSHPLAIGAHQHGIALSPDGRRLYLANNVFGGEGSLSEIDAQSFKELRRISLGKRHHEHVALDGTGRRAYLTGGFLLGGGGHDDLTVVELESGAVSEVRSGGRRPFWILFAP